MWPMGLLFVLSSVLYIVIMIRDKCSVGKMY